MSEPFGISHSIAVVVAKDSYEAVSMGYKYTTPEYLPALITKAVVVQNGTEAGRPTVDIIFQTPDGQKYVGMITARLLQTLVGATL